MTRSKTLRPFFTFYGGKWRAALHYPAPVYDLICEPFAGSAGYSLRYPERRVLLNDADEIITGTWSYLIRVSESEVRSLPITVSHVDDLNICQEAKWLIGFWLNKGTISPRKTPSRWMREGTRPSSFWGPEIRERIASQVQYIRHWRIRHGSYEGIKNGNASWFIDPPYNNKAGRLYRTKFDGYSDLAFWCKERRGQTIVCENKGADWLPFRNFRTIKSTPGSRGKGHSREAIWTKGDSDDEI